MKAKECIEKPRTGKWIKKNGTGRRSLHSVQLSLFKRNFAGMDGSRHRLFQGILQVPL